MAHRHANNRFFFSKTKQKLSTNQLLAILFVQSDYGTKLYKMVHNDLRCHWSCYYKSDPQKKRIISAIEDTKFHHHLQKNL